MLGLYTYSEICRSLVHVCDPETLTRYGLTPKGLRMSLQSRAQQFEPELPLWDTDSTVVVSACTTEKVLSNIFSGVGENSFEKSRTTLTDEERKQKTTRIGEALRLLQSMDPHLSEIMNVSISCIFTDAPSNSFDSGAVSYTHLTLPTKA